MFKKARYVLALYREGSFTKAAEALYISQPCLSAAIKDIEEEIGARLFERNTSPLAPTSIGFEYIKTAQEIVALEEGFALKVNDARGLLSGRIRVGGSNYVCSYILPHVIETFSALYPKITVEITEEHSLKLQKMLSKGEIDILVDSFDSEPCDFQYVPLFSEKILLAVPEKLQSNESLHGFSAYPTELYNGEKKAEQLERISMRHFADEKFILLKSGNSMFEHAMRIFKENGISPHVGMSLDQLSTSYFLCAEGSGCAFVTDTVFKYHKFNDPILLYNIKGSGSRTLGIAYKKDPFASNIIEKFVKAAKNGIK